VRTLVKKLAALACDFEKQHPREVFAVDYSRGYQEGMDSAARQLREALEDHIRSYLEYLP
jgi:hypothetical protein